MFNDQQLSLIQIGIRISEFLEPGEVPENLSDVAQIIHDNLGIEVKRGDNIPLLYDRICYALHERDRLVKMEGELIQVLSNEIREEIDKEIIADLIKFHKEIDFNDALTKAMKATE